MEEEPFQSESPGGEQTPPQEQPPTQETPPQEQYQHQPRHVPPQEPKKSLFEKLATDNMIAMLVVLGLLVIMIGAVIISAAPFQTNYDGEDQGYIEDDDGLTNKEMADREATENAMEYTGNILTNIGLFLLASGVLLGVFFRDDWDKWFRVALAGFALVIIIFAWFGGEFALSVGIS
ncbi:MAG: hypothetical protein R6W73_00025 [Candidatus Saliniplasma sp.]